MGKELEAFLLFFLLLYSPTAGTGKSLLPPSIHLKNTYPLPETDVPSLGFCFLLCIKGD